MTLRTRSQIIVFAVVAAAVAAPQNQQEVNIISQTFEQDEQGNYNWAYELDNGQKVGVKVHPVSCDGNDQLMWILRKEISSLAILGKAD